MQRRIAIAVGLLAVVPALGGIVYNEVPDGEFSADRLAPSALTLGLGSNLIGGTIGSTTPTSDTLDLDYVTLTVPAGLQLSNLVVKDVNAGGAFSFIGVEAGTQVSVPFNTASAATLLGYTHFGSASLNTDLLPEMSVALGAQGFSVPLGAGQYTIWLMELNTLDQYPFRFDFVVTAVPEPTGVVALAGLAGLALRRRK